MPHTTHVHDPFSNLWNAGHICDFSPSQGVAALALLQRMLDPNELAALTGLGSASSPMFSLPEHGWIPSPSLALSGTPAGQGLAVEAQGNDGNWPDGTVTTAGGYHVVANGGGTWSIYGPDDAYGETPHTQISGDPHVTEEDGTLWDFTRGSDFVLPDGTRIFAQTSAEDGQSVTTGLTIVNGADRVEISGVDGTPVAGSVTEDGYEWRGGHVGENPDRDSFYLAGDDDHVQWVRERNGVLDGVVTGTVGGAHQSLADGATWYDQTVDATEFAYVDPSMRPEWGSEAWGNLIRSQIDDQFASLGLGEDLSRLFGLSMHFDHALAEQFQAFAFLGGAWNPWGGYSDPFSTVQLLTNLIREGNEWRRQYVQGLERIP